MKGKHQAALFMGEKFLLIGWGRDDGLGVVVATQEQYETGSPAFAHLRQNGEIWRNEQVIGHEADLQLIGEVETNVKPQAFDRVLENLLGRSWREEGQ